MKRIAAYIRVSTEEQAKHGLSVEAQRHNIDEWAKQHKLKISDYYVDSGFSARKKAITRPEFQRLMQDVKAKKIDLIVFTKLDRWFRNVPEYYKAQEVLNAYNVSWETILEDYETETASGRFKVNIMLAVAQDEADRDSERIKVVMQRKKERGELTSGNAPFGYRYDLKTKTLQIDPEKEAAVRRFFELIQQTRSVASSCNTVISETGVRINYRLGHKMRQSEAYAGDFHGVKIPAYITPEQLKENIANIHEAPKLQKSNRVFLLSGLLHCAECGSRMAAHTQIRSRSPSSESWVEYQCNRYSYKGNCTNKTCISQAKVERYLLENLDADLARYNYNISLEQAKSQNDHTAEIQAAERKLERLKQLFVAELIDMDEYKTDAAPLREKIDSLRALQEATKKPPVEIKLPDGWKEIYRTLSDSGKAEFWASILRSIKVDFYRTITPEFK